MPSEVKFDIKYRVPTNIIYETLTNPIEIIKFTQCKAEFVKEVNGTFNFYEGFITGSNVELIENKKLAQKWKFSNLPTNVDVTMNFKEKPGKESLIQIIVKNIPERDNLNSSVDLKSIEKGFRTQIFEKIQNYLGYPMNNDVSSDSESD